MVSIHAPVWGATRLFVESRIFPILFQSTLPCGERREIVERIRPVDTFQSTLPCGERPGMEATQFKPGKFQSTLPCGERQWGSQTACSCTFGRPFARTPIFFTFYLLTKCKMYHKGPWRRCCEDPGEIMFTWGSQIIKPTMFLQDHRFP